WGIKVGATPNDVTFLKGKPSRGGGDDEQQWIYEKGEKNYYLVMFTKEKRLFHFVLCESTESYSTECPWIESISIGDSVQSVEKRFGTPSNVSTSRDQLQRVYAYDKYQVFFSFKQG